MDDQSVRVYDNNKFLFWQLIFSLKSLTFLLNPIQTEVNFCQK